MASSSGSTMLAFWLSLLLLLGQLCCCSCSQVFVVYMGEGSQTTGSGGQEDIRRLHHQMLASVHDGSMEKAQASHVYTYSTGFQGFAAKLDKDQAARLAEMPGVVSVFPDTKRSLHTTHSWDFMGLTTYADAEVPGLSTKNQENVIVGFIDTGEKTSVEQSSLMLHGNLSLGVENCCVVSIV